nr:hypothetical protein CFP56_11688 [Quercus suber]
MSSSPRALARTPGTRFRAASPASARWSGGSSTPNMEDPLGAIDLFIVGPHTSTLRRHAAERTRRRSGLALLHAPNVDGCESAPDLAPGTWMGDGRWCWVSGQYCDEDGSIWCA